MSRRQQSSSDSLELLLDTICNTFGGILFIAILVIIMLQMSSDSSENHTATADEIVEHQQLTTLLKNQQHELSRLQEILQGQEQTLEVMASAEIGTLLAERTRETKNREELIRQRDRIEQELEIYRDNEKKIEEDLANEQRSLLQTKKEVDELNQRLEEEQAKRVTEMNTSILRSSGNKSEVALVIQYDRFYVWHRYNSLGIRRGLNTDDFVILGESRLYLETTPNPVAGIPMNDSPESMTAIRRRLTAFNPAENYLAVIVKPDSFDSFHVLRDAAIALGFDYRLFPAEVDSPIVDRGGTGGRVQ